MGHVARTCLNGASVRDAGNRSDYFGSRRQEMGTPTTIKAVWQTTVRFAPGGLQRGLTARPFCRTYLAHDD
jgi:hypothetical protein